MGSEALVLAAAVSAGMTKPYLSVCTGLIGVIAASEDASAIDSNMSTHAQTLDDRVLPLVWLHWPDGCDSCIRSHVCNRQQNEHTCTNIG